MQFLPGLPLPKHVLTSRLWGFLKFKMSVTPGIFVLMCVFGLWLGLVFWFYFLIIS